MCLFEVDSARGGIDFGENFINAWERMHDDGLILHLVDEFPINLIAAFEFLIVFSVFEAFFLNACLVENVDSTFESVEIFGFSECHVMFGEVLFDIVTHSESLRRDKIYGDISIVSQEIGERTNGAAVFEITDEGDVYAIEFAEFALYGVEIEKGLRGVLTRSVSSIDNGYCGYEGGSFGCTFFIVSEDDDINIGIDDANGIFERFTFGNRREFFCVFGGDDAAAKSQHG